MNNVLNLVNSGERGVGLSQQLSVEFTCGLVVLTSLGLLGLGKKTADCLKQKIGEVNTIQLSMIGLVAGASSMAGAMVFESQPLVLLAGVVLPFSVGMTLATNKLENFYD